MSTLLAIIMLILLGIILLMVEFALIPGFTFAGIAGFISFGISIYLAFADYGTLAGFITLFAELLIVPVMIIYFFKSRTARKMMLETEISGKVNEIEQEKIQVGDTGIAMTRLGPIGKVKVNGIVLEGKSDGGYIDPHTEVEVIKVLPNQIIVKLK
ncbi:hypothetical protein EYV94_08850 [Puteibacter caeruleilacunae]|nr:hypothetical protein EYV94_08850 [Puteibacter caeruleilacunae]